MSTATADQPELWEDQDAILQELQEHQPESFSPAGYALHQDSQAVLQATDGNRMSADFVILTRSKQPNRQGNNHHILPNKFGQGLMTEEFSKNPVVYFGHGFEIPFPIGRAEDDSGKLHLTLKKTKVTSTVFFSQTFPVASIVFGLVDERIMRATSIGFLPRKAMLIKQEGKKKLPEGVFDLSPESFRGLDFTESELFEFSVLGNGADRGALKQCLDRGKVGTEKIPHFMRPVLQNLAGPKTVWSPGADFQSNQQDQKTEEEPEGGATRKQSGLYRFRYKIGELEEEFEFQSLKEMREFRQELHAEAQEETESDDEGETEGATESQSTVDSSVQEGTNNTQQQEAPSQEPDLVAAYQQQVGEQGQDALVGAVGEIVTKNFQPIQQGIKNTEDRMRQMTGRID